MSRILRILSFVLLVPAAAQATLLVGPAVPLTPPAESVGAYRPNHSPSVAWSGETGMVVWRARIGQQDFVLGNHVDSSGKPLEATPIVIWTEGQTLFSRVVPLGSRFLVVWQSFTDSGVGATRLALVEPDGTVVQRGPIATKPFHPTDVASNGTTALITGGGGDPLYDSVVLWVDADANVFSKKSFGSSLMVMTLARANGSSFLVAAQRLECAVYTCKHEFLLVHANADGTLSEPRIIRTVDEVQSFDYRLEGIAVSRDRFLAVFHERLGVMTGMLFEHDGDLASGPFPLEDTGASGSQVAVATDGNAFVVAYPHAIFNDPQPPVTTTRLRRVTSSGSSEPETLTQTPSIVALEWTGSGYVVARASDTPGITATRVPPNGQPIADAPVYVLSRAPNQQEAPDAVWDGAQLFTVWEEYQPLDGRWKIKYGTGRTIAESTRSQRNARIVFDGSRYLVLWTETALDNTTEIRARRLNRDGSFAGNAFLVTPTPACGSGFDAALVGNRVLVAHLSGSCQPFQPRSVVITPIEPGDTIATPIMVAENVMSPDRPVLATTGTTAFVVWSESLNRAPTDPCPSWYEYCPPKTVLRGAVIDGSSVNRVALADGPPLMVNRDPEIAWDGEHYLIVWLAANEVTALPMLRTQLFSANGAPASQPFVLTANGSSSFLGERHGTVIATENGFLVAWRRSAYMNSLSIWRVAPSGVPIDAVEREIEHEATDLRTPRLVHGPGSSSFLLYARSGPDNVYLGHDRILARSIMETVRGRAVRH